MLWNNCFFLLKQTVARFYSFLNLVRPPSLNLGLYSRRESPSRPFSGFWSDHFQERSNQWTKGGLTSQLAQVPDSSGPFPFIFHHFSIDFPSIVLFSIHFPRIWCKNSWISMEHAMDLCFTIPAGYWAQGMRGEVVPGRCHHLIGSQGARCPGGNPWRIHEKNGGETFWIFEVKGRESSPVGFKKFGNLVIYIYIYL